MSTRTDERGQLTATSFLRGLRLGVALISAAVLLPLGLLRNVDLYRPLWAQLAAYSVFVALVVVELALFARHRSWGAGRMPALLVVLLATAMALVSLPAGHVTGSANWVFGVAGWFGLILLLDRPIGWLVGFLVVHELLVGATVFASAPELATALNFLIGSLGAFGFPLAGGLAAAALRRVAIDAEDASHRAQALRTAEAVAARVHDDRRQRLDDLYDTTVPLLQGLADGALNPDEVDVQQACAIEAARMRRLFAETDEAPDQLLHSLRECVSVAERRQVLVEFDTRGHWPEPPLAVRRALTETPLAALATAQTRARVTVVGTPELLTIGVVADCGPLDQSEALAEVGVTVVHDDEQTHTWVESRWAPQ